MTRLVCIESPLHGDTKADRERNERYLDACMADCFRRGEAPFASHAIYTRVLDDDVPEQRKQGIDAGLAWACRADARVVYEDLGISRGMFEGIEHAKGIRQTIECRQLGGEWAKR